MGITPFSLKGERGWNRDYVAKVTDIIRKMISDGKVDENRVYLIGMSMGGGGVLQTISVAPDLFAAAVPICPSMNGESYANLLHLPKSSGMDHICLYGSPAQQTCVYSQCMQQAVAGRKNRCKIYIVYTGRTCKNMESEQQKGLPHRSLMQRIIIAGSLHYTTRMEF